MDKIARRRALRIALAISLALHLVFAAFVRARPVQAGPEVVPSRIIIHIWVRPKPTPTPPPPTHLVSYNQRTSVPAIRPIHVRPSHHGATVPPPAATGEPPAPGNTGHSAIGGGIGPVGPVETVAPGPACSNPNIEAKTIYAAPPEQFSMSDAGAGNVSTWIKVDLDASGNIVGASVYRSSGSMQLDQSALQAARASSYAPEVRDCRPVAGSYLFKVDFSD